MKKTVAAAIFLVIISGFLFLLNYFKVDIPFVKFGFRAKSVAEFSIGIFSGTDPFHLSETNAVINPAIMSSDVADIKAQAVADPFMLYDSDQWYLFCEVIDAKTQKGRIGCFTSKNALEWQYRRIVLEEPFHLSYPYVFSDGGAFYMIPESHQVKSVRLYKAKKFPTDWQLDSVLLTGLDFSDSSIVKYRGKWWLFTETAAHGFGTLRLYYADELRGPWREHPRSPVVDENENIARPGGRVFVYDGSLFRCTQDDTPTYGNQVRVFQIDRLTPDDYAEHEHIGSPVLESRKSYGHKVRLANWRSGGMHTLDPHEDGNGAWIACVDGVTRTVTSRQLVLTIEFPIYKNK